MFLSVENSLIVYLILNNDTVSLRKLRYNYCKLVSDKVKLFIDIPNDIIALETIVYIL